MTKAIVFEIPLNLSPFNGADFWQDWMEPAINNLRQELKGIPADRFLDLEIPGGVDFGSITRGIPGLPCVRFLAWRGEKAYRVTLEAVLLDN